MDIQQRQPVALPRQLIALLAGVFTVVSACTGEIGAPGSSMERRRVMGSHAGTSGTDPVGGNGGTEGPDAQAGQFSFTCSQTDSARRGLSFRGLQRLSSTQIANTVRALLGSTIADDATIAERLRGLPADRTFTAGDFTDQPPVALASVLAAVAARGSALAVASDAWKATNVPACGRGTSVSESCAQEFIGAFGARVWRRDLGESEVTSHLGTFREAGGGPAGLRLVLRRLLQAPPMVFHIEAGADAPDGTARLRLTDFEVAARLAFLATDGPPDSELLEAARLGELGTVEALRIQLRRLWKGDLVENKLRDFMRFYVQAGAIPDPPAAVAKQIGIASTQGLGVQMHDELMDFLEHVFVKQEGNFKDLMGSTSAFPRTPAMATIFETAELSRNAEPVLAGHHPGLLHRPAMLMSSGPRTSPIIRGTHVRKLFLCQSLALPSPEAVKTQEEKVRDEFGDLDLLSNREKTEKLTDAPLCRGCHNLVNGIGFAMEGYNQLGARRTEETLLDDTGKVVGRWPIDTGVNHPALEPGGPETLEDSGTLADALTESFAARACLAQRLLEYYRLSVVHLDADQCALHEIEKVAHDDSLAAMVATAVVNEDIFWRASP